MKFFDIFKKKKDSDTLYSFFKQVFSDPSQVIPFLDKLMESSLYVIVADGFVPDIKDGNIQQDSNLKLRIFEGNKVPVFTSVERIYDNGHEKGEVGYLELGSRSFFETTAGSTVILNPYSEYRKEFKPEEIQALLTGAYKTRHKPEKLKEDLNIQIMPMNQYPEVFEKVLMPLIKQNPIIEQAFLVFARYSETDIPHYLLGLYGNGAEQMIQDIGHALDIHGSDRPFDIMVIDDSNKNFFNGIQPCYQKL